MLANSVVQHWRQKVVSGGWTAGMASEEIRDARDFFSHLIHLGAKDARSRLVERASRDNRNLARLLFQDALSVDANVEPERAQGLAEWVEFIAEFGDALESRHEDALEAHCDFYKGMLQHASGDWAEAQQSYSRAELEYRDVKADPSFRGLAIYAQGATAFEAGNLEGGRAALAFGARERFDKALLLLRNADPLLANEVQSLIDRLLLQWQLVDGLIASPVQTEDLLLAKDGLLDAELLNLVSSRMWELAVGSDFGEARKVARIGEAVAARLRAPRSFNEDLVGYYFASKQPEAAVPILRELLEARPDDRQLLLQLAISLYQSGRLEESRTLTENLVHRYPDDAEIHSLLSVLLDLLGEPAEAESQLKKTLELDPDHVIAQMYLHRMNKPQVAVSFKDGTLSIGGDLHATPPEDLAAAMTAAILAAQPEQIDEQMAELTRSQPEFAAKVALLLRAREQSSAQSHFQRAEEFFARRKLTEAEDEYRRAIAAAPDMAPAYMGLGDVHYNRGEYYLAIAHFEESLAIEPTPHTYRFLGDAFRRVGKDGDAEKAYREAIRLNPNYRGAIQALADLQSKSQRR